MWVWVDWLGGTVLDASLAASTLLGLSALAMVGCLQPARRCGLARAAFLGSLALWPLVALGPDRPRVEVIRSFRSVVEPLVGPWPQPPPADPTAATGDQGQTRSASLLSSFASRIARLSPPGKVWAPRVFTVLYLSGTLIGLGWLALGWVLSAGLMRRAVEPSAATSELYRGLPFSGWRWRRPRLRISGRVGRPVLLGIACPTILVPPEFDQPEARERLRLGLLHELVHAERGDAWFSLAGRMAQTAWFFLPWVWWMKRQMRLDQEFLADHSASHDFGPFGTYASSLVDMAASGAQRTDPDASKATAVAPARARSFWGAGSALFQRILMLIRCPYTVETRAPRWWRWSLPPLVAFGTLLASTLTLQSADTVSASPAASSECDARSFQLARLVVAEAPATADGFTRPHDLPLLLPGQFKLSLDVWAEPADLSETQVVGRRLGIPASQALIAPLPAGWHSVEIHRDACHTIVRVDGKDVPSGGQVAGTTSIWLSVQPAPGRLGLYRNIRVTW